MAALANSLLSRFSKAERKVLEHAAEILDLQLEELIVLKHNSSSSKSSHLLESQENTSLYGPGNQQHGLSHGRLGSKAARPSLYHDLGLHSTDGLPAELQHQGLVGAATESLNEFTTVPLTGGWAITENESADPGNLPLERSNAHVTQGSPAHIGPPMNQTLRDSMLQTWNDISKASRMTSDFNPYTLDSAFIGLPQLASTAVGTGHDSGHFGHESSPYDLSVDSMGDGRYRQRQLTQWADSDTPPDSTDSQRESRVRMRPRNRKRKRSVSAGSRYDVDTHTSHPRQPVELSPERSAAQRTSKAVSCCVEDPSDIHGVCKTCSNVTGQTLVKLPCLRYKITDVKLLDKGSHPRLIWTRRWSSMKIVEVDTWFSPEVKTIKLTQDVFNTSYDINVQQFVPQPGDALERTWKTNGVAHSIPCAPYAIADMHETAKTVSRFVDNSISSYIQYHIDETDYFLKRTYTMAYRHYKMTQNPEQKALLNAVLRFWTASRMESKQERICSEETLGMSPQTSDKEAENFDNICLPPVMQAQVEIITTSAILKPMQKEIIKHLNDLVKAKDRPVRWFTLYLCMFVLLHSCALLTRAQHKRARRHNPIGCSTRYYNPSVVEEIHWGAKIMLAHFHYANNGCQPFKMDWSKPQTSTFANLDEEQVAFVRETIEHIAQRRERFDRILGDGEFEDEYYFLAQMYELEWRPRHTV